MDKTRSLVDGRLANGHEEIHVKITPATTYTMYIKLDEQSIVQDNTEFDRLVIKVGTEEIELGSSRFIRQAENPDYDGYLVFTKDIYNVPDLFQRQKKSPLQRGFNNLPFILSHKDHVKQEFKDYCSDLTYCLSVYRQLFENMDNEYLAEPEFIREMIQQTIITNEGAEFLRYFEKRLKELEKLVANFTQEEHERHGYYFRRQVWGFIRESEIMFRNNIKPRGYSGDFEIMRMIYKMDILGNSTFSRLMHKHPVEHPAAQAVRNRRKLISESLIDAAAHVDLAKGHRLKVLSVACGPAFELKDILATADECQKYELTLLDQDEQALREAAALIDEIQEQLQQNIMVTYLQESVRIMMSPRRLSSQWGKYHFIYSMGLFDYLTPPVAKAVISNLYRLLEPGGQLLIGNFHRSNPSRVYMEYWNDWVLFYRTEEDMLSLLQQAEAEHSLEFEGTGSQMFLEVTRPGNAID
ncbi:class I SAM-dependent methyltransferase [Candidatus Neomarinimicrobiota bacterium]